mmetsp:Transcript_8088/g.9744  ORF Transcript_8088/g.9744 Transcript_8088/m.9744 type:complete len:431 (+) Transcript_8088:231-1523(+)
MENIEGLSESVETTINRVNSAVFSQNELKEKKKDEDLKLWPAAGLSLSRKGVVVKGTKHLLKELLKGVLRGGCIGFALKASLNLVFALVKRKGASGIVKEIFCEDVYSFVRFLSAYLGLFRFTNAYLAQKSGKDTDRNAATAGFVASLAILLDQTERRKGIALFCLVRALDVKVKSMVRLGQLPYISFFESFMFGITNIPIAYGFLYEPEILDKGYYKWILNMGNVPEEGIQKTFREPMYARERGEFLPFQPCCPHYHEGTCVHHITTDFFHCLGRAGKIYLPVHILPLLLFRYKSLMNDTVGTLSHTGKAFISSCVFLSSYVQIMKSTVCFNRNRLKRDERWFGVVAGLLTSFATYFERSSRVSELMLYCLPRSLTAAWIFLERRNMVSMVPFYEVPMFAVAMSILMSCKRGDFKPAYHRQLAWLIGNK